MDIVKISNLKLSKNKNNPCSLRSLAGSRAIIIVSMTISVNMLDARAVTVYVARAPVSNQIVAYSRKWRNETFDYQYFSCLLTCSSPVFC